VGTTLSIVVAAIVAPWADADPMLVEEFDGRPVALSLRTGETGLVVHFWATWCPSCVEELAVVDAAAQACGDDVRVVAVNVAEDPEEVRRFLSGLPLGLRQLRDASGDVWREVSGRGLPVNLILTRGGRRVEVGPRDADGWRQMLGDLGCH
jgi:thiol-disulfide isomerase/thioredoxin